MMFYCHFYNFTCGVPVFLEKLLSPAKLEYDRRTSMFWVSPGGRSVQIRAADLSPYVTP